MNGALETVVERLAARGPNPIRPVHCWFCAKIEPWWTCDCKDARDARNGLRAKPRYDAKLGAMILDEDIIERNVAWGIARRMAANDPANKPDVSSETANAEPVSRESANADGDRAEARRAYQRELMRKRREAARQT